MKVIMSIHTKVMELRMCSRQNNEFIKKKYGFLRDEGCYLYYNKKRTTVLKGMD